MKITKIAHASILAEAEGIRILSDPWWRGPCFGAQWWLHPPAHLAPVEEKRIDYIYVSHGHHDHYHPGTLVLFPKDTPILVSKENDLAEAIGKLGYQVIALGPDEEFALSPTLKCRIIPTHGDDSLMALTDGKETLLNLNDALHSATAGVQEEFIGRLNRLYPKIDYVFCGYGIASHFPNCYDIPGKDAKASVVRRQGHFTRQWVNIIQGLNPRFGFPFAADVVFFEKELFWCNEGARNGESPSQAFRRLHPGSPVRVFDCDSGFCVQDGTITEPKQTSMISNAALDRERKTEIDQANRIRAVTDESMEELARLLERNIALCLPYLREFPGDYSLRVRIKGAERDVEIRKRGAAIATALIPSAGDGAQAHDVVFTTRLAYLRNSLTTQYGHEVLFVGSGGIFRFRDATRLKEGLNREFMVMLKRHPACPASRYGKSSRLAHAVKSLIKKAIGGKQDDLYDLAAWTDFGT